MTTQPSHPSVQPADGLTPSQMEDLRIWLSDATGLIGDHPDWYLNPGNATDQQVVEQIEVMFEDDAITGDDLPWGPTREIDTDDVDEGDLW